jgi:hypothetical protein
MMEICEMVMTIPGSMNSPGSPSFPWSPGEIEEMRDAERRAYLNLIREHRKAWADAHSKKKA